MTYPIRRAGAGDTAAASHLVAEAFEELPPSRWLVADVFSRITVLERYFRIWVGYALAYGHVDLLTDGSGAAVWLPQGPAPFPEPAGYASRRATAAGPWLPRFVELDRALGDQPPRPEHDHLLYLAVRPRAQRTGRGTALLRHHLAHLDRTGRAAHLEAADQPLISLYASFGFVAEPPLMLPGGPAFWPMWRHPAGH